MSISPPFELAPGNKFQLIATGAEDTKIRISVYRRLLQNCEPDPYAYQPRNSISCENWPFPGLWSAKFTYFGQDRGVSGRPIFFLKTILLRHILSCVQTEPGYPIICEISHIWGNDSPSPQRRSQRKAKKSGVGIMNTTSRGRSTAATMYRPVNRIPLAK